MDGASGLIVKVTVWARVLAISGGFAINVDLLDDSVFYEGFKAVINGGK